MNLSSSLPLLVALLGQAPSPPDANNTPEEAAARLDFMKKAVAVYSIHPTDDRATTYRLRPEPILRFTNPVGKSRDGAIFLWLGAQDRPEVADQVNVIQSGRWNHQFSSLSARPLAAESSSGAVWSPSRGGVEFKPVPGAPKPAETAEQRLRQMRAIAQEFTVEDDFQGEGWQSLRLMARPLARYGKPGKDLIDGVLFCFALTTDPEAFLLLEARAGKDGPEWYYAFAPITAYDVKASHQKRQVWSTDWPTNTRGPNGTLFLFQYAQGAAAP